MGDKLVRLRDIQNRCHFIQDDYGEWILAADIIKLPAVDAVEGVVRCRDCVHYYDVLRQGTQFESGSCDRWFDGTAFSPDDYCSRGQRREDGENGQHL